MLSPFTWSSAAVFCSMCQQAAVLHPYHTWGRTLSAAGRLQVHAMHQLISARSPTAGGTEQNMQHPTSAPKSSFASHLHHSPCLGKAGCFLAIAICCRGQMMSTGAGGKEGFVLVLAEQRETEEAGWLERMVCEK